jgi:glutamyl-Q tRNA(Asp) synthetase
MQTPRQLRLTNRAMSIASTKLTSQPYIGRFAPSPTGPLHFGSLVAAVASYCDAKANNGKWLIRMEDLDKPREVAGAAKTILLQLESFGFEWDGESSQSKIMYQSQRSDIYENYLYNLQRNGFVYSCHCSRKEIADSSILMGVDGAIYPKTCFKKMLENTLQISHKKPSSDFHASASRMDAGSQRINVEGATKISFKDAIQGDISQALQTDVGDFILKRKDGIFAYQLAVVADDALQNVTHIVRGADLLDSTPRQIYLQYLLDFSTPNYAHTPVATNAQGEKLSKQTLAQPCFFTKSPKQFAEQALLIQQLFNALTFLGQNPPIDMQKNATLGETWRWAFAHWKVSQVPKKRAIVANI